MDKGLLDIGLLLEPIDMDKYDYVRMAEREEWGVLMRPDDPLASRDSLTAADLSALPLILPRRLSVQSELANWFGRDYSRLNVRFTSNLSTKFLRHGAAGSGLFDGQFAALCPSATRAKSYFAHCLRLFLRPAYWRGGGSSLFPWQQQNSSNLRNAF